MNDIRENLRRIAAEQSRDRLVLLGAGASVCWLLLVCLFAYFGPSAESASSGIGRLLGFVGVVMPIALIWLAVGLGRSIASLQAEAAELRASVALLGRDGDIPAAPTIRHIPSPPRAATAKPEAASAAASGAADSLDPPPLALDEYELISAINFPNGPEDEDAIAALRKALADPELARLIRAAQDVVTLLSKRGVFMEELYTREPDPEGWRRFTAGARGAAVAGLALDVDAQFLDTASEMIRFDEVFRDVAQHFLRRFDKLLCRAAPELDDRLLLAMTYTRSGRAFTLLAQATGMIGEYLPQEPQSA
ncbi:hypothetical protein [Paracoccus sp. (in: a-proteobacteria)]|uniref:hypothetical protein n=1 Tax=Paracoccus sp. TaxID=267 RepID=UPI0028A18A7E|nr:hypothetical protein [Paracoccus sp. (in: a-proteobacteria)]